MSTIEYRDPKSLKNHLVNIEIYGTHPSDEFVRSVAQHGVLVPLTITADGTVISGHSRRQAAIVAHVELVPCVVSPLTDPDEIEQSLIESNRQREKTNEQRAREAAHLFAIEERLAAKRQKATQAKPGEKAAQGGGNVATTLKQGENADSGTTRDKVGKVVGMGGRTVEAAVQVVQKIDEAKAQGDEAKATRLTRTLNEKGVAPALREAQATTAVADEAEGDLFTLEDDEPGLPIEESLALGKEFDRINREVRALIRQMKELGTKPGGAFLNPNKLQEIEDKIGNGLSAFLGAKPYERCPYCLGTGCKGCHESGIVTRMIFDNAPEAKRKAVRHAA